MPTGPAASPTPLEVIEQITYVLFLKRLDDLHTLEENKSTRLKKPMERRVFPEGNDPKGRAYEDCRWSRFKHFAPAEMFAVVNDHVFPFLRTLGGDNSTYAHHMKDARFTIPTTALLAKVVDMIEQVPMEDRDTKGDLYQYMLGKIASAGQNGQFRTRRHIIRRMVEMVAPQPTDIICDPACGTAGFLMTAGEYLREHHPQILRDAKLKEHFHHHLFHGFDFDNTMLGIGSMNMLLHGVENWYAKLLRLYPKPYRERREAGVGLFGFVLWMFVETFTEIIRQHLTFIIMQKSMIRVAIGTGLILLIPLVFTLLGCWHWRPRAFIFFFVLLFGAGLTYELVAKRMSNKAYRFAVGLAVATALILTWMNLAVGIIGDDNPANLMYFGVLAFGIIGAVIARLEPRGMARALLATALAQTLVPVIALIFWKTNFAPGVSLVFGLNAVFVMLFVGSALLFRHAGANRL